MAEWEQVKCKYCHKDLDNVPGKVKKQFCCDAHRKASKRLESGKTESVAGSPVDELRTNGTNQPRTSTSDKPKRGKDIKVFADLPAHVQMTINRMSGHDKTEHKRRTAIAIHYQTTCFGPQGM